MIRKLNAVESLSLILSLTSYLGKHKTVPIETLAAHFGVSEDAIESAVRTLGVSGVGRYATNEIFDVNYAALDEDRIVDVANLQAIDEVPRLSTAEAAIFLSGLSYLRSIPEFSEDADVLELIKLLNVGASAPQSRIYEIRPGTPEYDFTQLRKAISNQVRIRCEYLNLKGERSERELHPLRLESRDQIWYLQAFCEKNQDVRFFRIEQMRIVEITDTPISDAARAVELREELFENNSTDIAVTVELEPTAFSMAAEFSDGTPAIELEDGRIRTVIKIGYLPYLGKLISQFGGAAVVVAPAEARAVVRDYALRSLGESGLDATEINEE
jgi:proteasome accessory factor C